MSSVKCICGETVPFSCFRCHHCGRELFAEIASSNEVETPGAEEDEFGDQLFELS